MDADKEFQKFLNNSDPNFFSLMIGLREKSRSIADMYKLSFKNYHETNDDEIRKMLKEFIKRLINDFQTSMEQVDIIISDIISDEDDEDDDLNIGGNIEN